MLWLAANEHRIQGTDRYSELELNITGYNVQIDTACITLNITGYKVQLDTVYWS